MARHKNKNTPTEITGGIYEGDTGTYQADEDPLGYYKFALANEGKTGLNSSPFAWDYLMNQGYQNIFDSYQNAQGADKNLQFINHMANTYGAGRTPTALNPYAGNSALAPVVVDQQWGNPDGRRRHRR